MKKTEVENPELEDDEVEDLGDDDAFLEVGDDEIPEDTIVFSSAKGSDNVGDVSVEINVEDLIAEFEASQNAEAARKKEIRRRLEEIAEQRAAMKELEDTFSFDMNDED
jgi:predicted FMN-binding regulatory protein PaiB